MVIRGVMGGDITGDKTDIEKTTHLDVGSDGRFDVHTLSGVEVEASGVL